MNQAFHTTQDRIADAMRAVRHVFVRDLVLQARIGVYDHEKRDAQKIIVNLDLTVSEAGKGHGDNIDNVVCYEKAVNGIRAIIGGGHINLVETMAEEIAAFCLDDPRVLAARVRVEKPDVIAEAGSVGVEIERTRPLT